MQRRRTKMSRKNKWFLEKYELLTATNFAYCYEYWKVELDKIGDGVKAVDYDGQPRGTKENNLVEDIAIRRSELSNKIEMVEATCRIANPEIEKWLLIGVTKKWAGYDYLRNTLGMPCGHNVYYQARQKFHYLLYQKMMKS